VSDFFLRRQAGNSDGIADMENRCEIIGVTLQRRRNRR
jgi:hypothetical protein